MTGKTLRMTNRDSFERSFFQPECVAQFRGRLSYIFVGGITLRLVGLMTNRATFLARYFGFWVGKRRFSPLSVPIFVPADDFDVLVVGEKDLKIGHVSFSFHSRIENFSRIRKRMSRAITRRRICMTNRTNNGRRASEKLLTMAVQTGY